MDIEPPAQLKADLITPQAEKLATLVKPGVLFRLCLLSSAYVIIHSLILFSFGEHVAAPFRFIFAVLDLFTFAVFFVSSPFCDFIVQVVQAGRIERMAIPKSSSLESTESMLRRFLAQNGPEIISLFRQRVGSWRGFTILTLSLFIGCLLGSVKSLWAMTTWGMTNLNLMHILVSIFIVPLIFPFTSALALMLWTSAVGRLALLPVDEPVTSRKGITGIYHLIKRRSIERISYFLIYEFPFASVCFAYLTGIIMTAFWPLNVGGLLVGWLLQSANDANLASAGSPIFSFVVSLMLSLFLCRTFAPLALRLGAFYQLTLQKFAMGPTAGNLTEALTYAISVPRTRVAISPQHPNWCALRESIGWIAICYCILFSFVAFCPGALGQAITNWLDACIKDAQGTILHFGAQLSHVFKHHPMPTIVQKPNLPTVVQGGDFSLLRNHFNLKLFLASVFAAYGTAPFAVMTCAFLPLRRHDEILLSEQGLLQPNRLLGSPLLFWRNLHKISLQTKGSAARSRQTLQLVFRPGGTIKIRLNTLLNEHLAQMLAMADEYATNCQFDEGAVQLRSELIKESSSGSLAQANKFASTIFEPHSAGDKIHNGKFRIVRKLASKPLSTVYLARDRGSRLVVIKQLVLPNNDLQTEGKYRKMLHREYEVLRSLNHPMLARIVDVFDEGNASYLVLEHIAGEDLRRYVSRLGPRSEEDVIGWANELCGLMQFLHSHEPTILHRDLTPENIMLDEAGRIRIVDFGAAHQFMEGVTGTLVGKQCYIAPEQLRGKANVSSDVYSFGCTLYYLLTGQDPRALSQSDLTGTNYKISTSMIELIKSCTEFEASKRPASFHEVSLALRLIPNAKSQNLMALPWNLSKDNSQKIDISLKRKEHLL